MKLLAHADQKDEGGNKEVEGGRHAQEGGASQPRCAEWDCGNADLQQDAKF